MEITGRGFLKKQVPSWDAALRNTNTAPRYENMTGKPQLIGSCAVSLGGQAPAGGAAGFAGADRPGHRNPNPYQRVCQARRSAFQVLVVVSSIWQPDSWMRAKYRRVARRRAGVCRLQW